LLRVGDINPPVFLEHGDLIIIPHDKTHWLETTLKQIGSKVQAGYSSETALIRAFKSKFGETPARYSKAKQTLPA